MYVVYKHTSPSNKVYIGITSQDVNKRWAYGYGYMNNDHFWKAICKYGWNNFKHEIVANNLSKQDACNLEIELIKKYKSNDPNFGYNLSSGGEHAGYGIHCSDETKKKISQSRRGEKHWFYGKHLSSEHRRKISESNKGKIMSNTTKLKHKEIGTRLRGKAVRCIETNTIYPSTSEAARSMNVQRAALIRVLHGDRKTTGGYHWEYVQDL